MTENVYALFKKIMILVLAVSFLVSCVSCDNGEINNSGDAVSAESFDIAVSLEESEEISLEVVESSAEAEESSFEASKDNGEPSSEEISQGVSEDESSEEISEIHSEEPSEDNSSEELDPNAPLKVYAPEVQDKITYSNGGIYLYNTEFRMSEELENEFLKLFASFENPQSVTLRELNTDFVFSYNPNKRIATASAIKGPFGLFAAKSIEAGKLSWEDRLVFQKKYDTFAGSGAIQGNYEYGTKFSVSRLYYLMLRVSDNIAYLMLKDALGGAKPFNEAINDICGNDIIESGNWGYLTSFEMSMIWREIYYYYKNGSDCALEMAEQFYYARYNDLWAHIPRCENFHKSGWSAKAYNDAGVLFDGNQVYSLAIMTGRKDLADMRNRAQLEKIAKLVDRLMIEYNSYLGDEPSEEPPSEIPEEPSSEILEEPSEEPSAELPSEVSEEPLEEDLEKSFNS